MTPEEYQELLDSGYTEADLYEMGISPPTGISASATTVAPTVGVQQGPTTSPTGIPAWLWTAYQNAQSEYDAALQAYNDAGEMAAYTGQKDRLANAQKNLQSVGGQLDNFKTVAAQPKATLWTDPTNGSQWAVDPVTYEKKTQVSGAIPGFRPQGVPAPSQGSQPPSAWDQAWKQKTFDYEAEQDKLAREQQQQTLAQQKKRDAWTMVSDSLAGQLKATDIAAMPGQEYYLGHEPGGVSESIARKLGVAYNPEAWRIKTIPYDPEAEWQKAWARTNGQG
jgi:hypothetical protein